MIANALEFRLRRRKETAYKDIHVHVLIKTVEGQDAERYTTVLRRLQPQTHEYAKLGIRHNNMQALPSFMRKIIKNIGAVSDVLTIVEKIYQDIYKATKSIGKSKHLVKTGAMKTISQRIQIDALLTKIMDNEASRAYVLKMLAGTKNGIYHK